MTDYSHDTNTPSSITLAVSSTIPSISETSDMGATNKRPASDATQGHHKKPKTTVSVAGLFAKKNCPQQENQNASSGANDKHAGDKPRKDSETARAKLHPAFIEVKEATTAYGDCKAANVASQLDAAEDKLIARIEGIDINGKPVTTPGIPSQAEFRAMEDDKKLCRHLTEDIITVAITKPDGTVSHKDVKLGDSMLKMRELLDETETKVMNLVAELTEVDEELMSSLREFNEVTKAEGDVLRKKISNLQADAEAYYKQTLENVSKARKEDQALNIEANRKLQAFMASLF